MAGEEAEAGRLGTRFRDRFGGEPLLFRAPGRVNIIGEHTDYNDGFVMPAALRYATWAAVAPRRDGLLRVHSLATDATAEFDLAASDPAPRHDWTDYVRGVALMLDRAGHGVGGADMMLASTVPIGAGLSSSAALEVVVGYALVSLAGRTIDLAELARICQRAENEFVGMRCGIMDQFIACKGVEGHALMIDCRSLEAQPVPIDDRVRIVVANSMVKHAHAGGEYNRRREACEQGVALLKQVLPGMKALRDVSAEQLERHAGLLPELIYRRCRHIVSENDRVRRAAAAFTAGDFAECGRLMTQSHASMRDDYEITCPEVDRLVEIALAADGAFGARMTGGGFGGCVVSLVEADATDRFVERVSEGYRQATGLAPDIFTFSPGPGVGPAAS